MTAWETMERDQLAIQSHTDWFIRGAMAGLDRMFEELSSLAGSDEVLGRLANSAADIKELLESAGTGVYHMALNSVHLTGSLVLARRDSFLEFMKNSLSRERLWQLRFSDMQGGFLFDQGVLEVAKDEATKRRSESNQDKLIAAIKESTAAKSTPGQKQTKPFQRKPFQADQGQSQYQSSGGSGGRGGRGKQRGGYGQRGKKFGRGGNNSNPNYANTGNSNQKGGRSQ